jgi:hypothetical protein
VVITTIPLVQANFYGFDLEREVFGVLATEGEVTAHVPKTWMPAGSPHLANNKSANVHERIVFQIK